MTLPVAVRQTMHGPLWTARLDDPYRYVQLWGPNHDRDHWSAGWTVSKSDEDDTEYADSGFEKAATLGEIPGLVPAYLSPMFGAAISAAQQYDPNERCSHVKASSYSVRADGRVCGYCGRLYQPEPEEAEA